MQSQNAIAKDWRTGRGQMAYRTGNGRLVKLFLKKQMRIILFFNQKDMSINMRLRFGDLGRGGRLQIGSQVNLGSSLRYHH